jgi:phage shock protein A
MALLERVTTLIRANLNDLIDKAEDPEKMIKQVIVDMENQYVQVKTQVAIAIADLHLLEKKKKENQDATDEWFHKAERSVDQQQDDLARAALERYRGLQQIGSSYGEQLADQETQVQSLKNALHKLDQKLAEAKLKKDLLIARHRRTQTAGRANQAEGAMTGHANVGAFDRMSDKVLRAEAVVEAHKELSGENIEDRFAQIERNDEIERLLATIKERRALNP